LEIPIVVASQVPVVTVRSVVRLVLLAQVESAVLSMFERPTSDFVPVWRRNIRIAAAFPANFD
jgi:hypothetical protein